MDPEGNWSWRFRVVDVHVSVCGPERQLYAVRSMLKSAHRTLTRLEVGFNISLTGQPAVLDTCNVMKVTHSGSVMHGWRNQSGPRF